MEYWITLTWRTDSPNRLSSACSTSLGGKQRLPIHTLSFPYAKRSEDAPQQVIGAEHAGDFFQRALRQAQFLGHQFTGTPVRELAGGSFDAFARTRQCLNVPL